jgi:Asp-tRNA(Asn)/Glu-tRNA(Gln) amidotransferase A subunit family amidase
LGADLAAFHPHALALCAIAGLAGAPQVRIPLGGGGGAGLSPIARPGADRALLALAARLHASADKDAWRPQPCARSSHARQPCAR